MNLLTRRFVVLACLSFSSSIALAVDPSATELQLIPKYCEARLGEKNSPQYQNWSRKIGPDFQAIHHYCFALILDIRANREIGDRRMREYLLDSAIDNYSYMINHSSKGFKLRPDFFIRRGKDWNRLGKTSKAIADFHEAMRLRPDHSASYVALADLYKNSGDIEAATKIVDEGIENVPRSKALKRRKAELDKQISASNTSREGSPE